MEQQNLNNPISENLNNKKNHGKSGGILLCFIIGTVLLLYLSLFTVFPLVELTGLAALAIFCGCYSVILYKASFIPCIIVPGISVAAIFFVSGSQGRFDTVTLACCVNLAFAVILSAVLNGCTVKKSSGSTTFVTLTIGVVLYIVSVLLIVVYEVYGNIGISTLQKALNDAAAFAGSTFTNIQENVSVGSSEQVEAYKSLLKELGKNVQAAFKLTFPSMIAMTAMFVSSLIYVLYKPFIKLAGLEKECFEGRVWRFEVSPAGAILFEVVFFIYIILSFFSQNPVLNVAFMNLISVLTVPFAYIGLRYLTGLLKKKLESRIGAIAIVTVACLCLMLLLGVSILTFAALIGASSVTRKRIEDKQ